MATKNARWWLGLGAALTLIGCAAAEKQSAEQGQSYAGWYREHAGRGIFQLCGQSQQWRVTAPADLPARAKAFGLEPDTPVYVRLLGVQTASAHALEVTRVEQFGSTTPVRDCGMTGVVIPAPGPATD